MSRESTLLTSPQVKKQKKYCRERTSELETVNKELESFIYSASHDLRAPIRTMAGFADFMIEDYADKLDDAGKNYLSRIQACSEKMARLIEDLLRLSRINRQEISRIETDLSSKVSAIIEEFRECRSRQKCRGQDSAWTLKPPRTQY